MASAVWFGRKAYRGIFLTREDAQKGVVAQVVGKGGRWRSDKSFVRGWAWELVRRGEVVARVRRRPLNSMVSDLTS